MGSSQLAYIAGIIDGEGSIMIARKRSARSRGGWTYALTASVTNTSRPLIDWLHQTTGLGHIAPHFDARPENKSAWLWSLWSREAQSLIEQVLPFLLVKRQHAELGLRFQSTMRLNGGLTEEEWLERAKMHETMRLLNRRGRNSDPEWMIQALADGWLAPARME